MIQQPLSRDDLAQLDAALARLLPEASMNVENLDGFLSAVICGPRDVPSTELVRRIIGRIDLFEYGEFAVPPYMRDLVFFASRLRDARARTLRSEQTVVPLLVPNSHGVCLGNDWARGFLREVESNRDEWHPLMQNVRFGGCMAPIFALAHEHDPDPDLRLFAEPVSDAVRRKLVDCIGPSLSTIYRFHNSQRMSPSLYRDLGERA